jgi:hypothetical protein
MSMDYTALAITLYVPATLWAAWQQGGLSAPALLQHHGLWPAFLKGTLWSYRCVCDDPVGWASIQITFQYHLPTPSL